MVQKADMADFASNGPWDLLERQATAGDIELVDLGGNRGMWSCLLTSLDRAPVAAPLVMMRGNW